MTRPRKVKAHHDRLRDLGEAHFNAGRPISAFYEVKLSRHNELERASYELGWRAAKEEARAKARAASREAT